MLVGIVDGLVALLADSAFRVVRRGGSAFLGELPQYLADVVVDS